MNVPAVVMIIFVRLCSQRVSPRSSRVHSMTFVSLSLALTTEPPVCACQWLWLCVQNQSGCISYHGGDPAQAICWNIHTTTLVACAHRLPCIWLSWSYIIHARLWCWLSLTATSPSRVCAPVPVPKRTCVCRWGTRMYVYVCVSAPRPLCVVLATTRSNYRQRLSYVWAHLCCAIERVQPLFLYL